MKNLLLALGLTVILSPFCAGQTNHKSKIIVGCAGRDLLGKTLCSKVKDSLAQSPRFIEEPDSDENSKKYVKIAIITVAPAAEDSNFTAISVVYTLSGYLLHHTVETCGRNRIADCAQDVLTDLDDDDVSWATKITK